MTNKQSPYEKRKNFFLGLFKVSMIIKLSLSKQFLYFNRMKKIIFIFSVELKAKLYLRYNYNTNKNRIPF